MEFEPLPPRFMRLPFAWQAAGLAGGALAMAGASQIELDLGPVPLTAQTLAVFLLAGAMGQRAALSIALWLLAATLGAPVLSGGSTDVFGPTQGYLVGMVLAAAFAGRLAERSRRVHSLFAALFMGHALVLLFGFMGLLRTYSPEDAARFGVFPFIVGAVVKVALATAALYAAARALPRKAVA